MNRKIIASIVVLAMAGILIAQGVVRLEARMVNGAAKGKAKYKISNRAGRQVQEEIGFEGENLAPNTTYTFTAAGMPVGEATTDGFGAFEWDRRSVGTQRYVIPSGARVTIENANGVILQGVLQPRL